MIPPKPVNFTKIKTPFSFGSILTELNSQQFQKLKQHACPIILLVKFDSVPLFISISSTFFKFYENCTDFSTVHY